MKPTVFFPVTRGRLTVALACCALLLAPGSARADDAWEQDRGFRLGIHLNGNGLAVEDPAPGAASDQLYLDESGGGLTLTAGYSFSPLFALCLSLSGAEHGTTQEGVEAYYSTMFIEGHFRFLPRERVRPYLIAGLGGAALAVDSQGYDSETHGGGMVLGVGMLWNLTEHLLLDAALRLDIIEWDEVEVTRTLPNGQEVRLADPVDEEGGAGRMQLGLTWAF